jgi:hypothetical protein
MHFPVPQPDGSTVIEVDPGETTCVIPECGGPIVRHSLGSGQAVYRCVKCFRRYQSRPAAGEVGTPHERGRWRRMLRDFAGWRDDD